MNYQNLVKPSCFFLVLFLVVFSYFFLDLAASAWIQHHLLFLKPITKFVYVLFNGAVVLPIIGLLVLLALKLERLKGWRIWLIQLFCGLFGGQLILLVGKILIGRARPYQALLQGYQSFAPLHLNPAFFSFPSGHTLNIMLIAGFLSLRFPARAKLILGLGLGLSFFRVLGLDHFISDWILTIYLAGMILLMTTKLFESKYFIISKKWMSYHSEDNK